MSIQSEIERIKQEKISMIEGGNKSYKILEGTKKVRDYCFYNYSLPNIGDTLPNSIEEIGAYGFFGTESYITKLPDSLKKIGSNAFRRSSISISYLPEGLESIGDQVFLNQSNIDISIMPASVKSIGIRAFEGCDLKEITFKGKPDSIGSGIFNSNPNLTTVRVPWSKDDEVLSSVNWGIDAENIIYDYTGE